MSTRPIENHQVVSRAEWLTARRELLKKEKEATRLHDDLARQRRELPWVRVEKKYLFEGAKGKVTLADLFAGKNQLVVYHFMFGPEWKEGCPSCSFNMDHVNPALVHLAQRDVAFAAISRAPYAKIEPFQKRMGWKFNWVSSNANEFNQDYRVSFTKDELTRGDIYNFGTSGFPSEEGPGFSVFCKNDNGEVFHTYSSFARGSESTINTYNYLDMVPKGRDEDELPFPMAWIRHHDRYVDMKLADADKPYWPGNAATAGK